MDTRKQFTIIREFAAPREAVWRAWTDPAMAAQWWHPHEVVTPPESVQIDLRVGGTYEYLMIAPDGSEYPTGGEYLEVDGVEVRDLDGIETIELDSLDELLDRISGPDED